MERNRNHAFDQTSTKISSKLGRDHVEQAANAIRSAFVFSNAIAGAIVAIVTIVVRRSCEFAAERSGGAQSGLPWGEHRD